MRTKIFGVEDWRRRVQQLWDREIAKERTRCADDEPRHWPGYQLKRARLFEVAGHLRQFIGALPADAELLTEHPLSAANGRIYGRPDLIIRNPKCHKIIDYKSGGILERETGRPREAYVRQLQLYAFLEREESGSWPATAHLLPLHGAPIEIDIDPKLCLELAAKALDALNAYNSVVPGIPSATPTLFNCRWCPHVTVCASFWTAYDGSWGPELIAVAGSVSQVFATVLGGVTIRLNTREGLVTEPTIVIKNIDPFLFSGARDMRAGDEIAVAGLVADEHGSGYFLRSSGSIKVSRTEKMAL